MKKYLFLFFSFSFFFQLSAQTASDDSYLGDFNVLVRSLQELHPVLYTNISKDAFDTEVALISQRLLTVTSRMKAIYIIQELMYKLGNSHAGNTSVFEDMGVMKALPFSVYIIDHELFFKDYPADTSLNGTKILAIENTNSAQLIDSMKIFFPTDGNNGVISNNLERLFNNIYGAFSSQKDMFTIKTEKGIIKTAAAVRGTELFDKMVLNNYESYFGKDRFIKKVITPDYGYFKFIGFRSTFKSYNIEDEYNAFIKEANEKNLKAIVIDLRNNSGGDPYLMGRMTSCLIDKPFKIFERLYITQTGIPSYMKYMTQHSYYRMRTLKSRDQGQLREVVRFEKGIKTMEPSPQRFKGKIYIITGSITQSSSTMMCKLLMNDPNVTFVGSEPIGSINYFWANTSCDLKLPALNTNFEFGMELIELKKDCHLKECPEPLIPQHLINYTIAELMEGTDKEMEFIIGDIKQ